MAALTPARVLCVAPDAALEPPAGVERSLQAALGGVACHLSYAQALGLFGKRSPFGKVLRGPPRHAVPAKALVQATVFLLQRRALVALHTYVHCVAEPLPPSEPVAAAARARWQLFQQVRPMFSGEHHLEEIAWQEGIAADTLRDLLAAYDECVVLIQSC